MSSAPGRVAGIDFGTVRIGIAISDPGRRIASPHQVYTRRSSELDARHFQQLAQQEEITLFVVGLPIFASGDESPISGKARAFGAWLQQQTGVPTIFFDERYSTQEADELLHQRKFTRDQQKARRDMLAAQVLLSAFLESGDSQKAPGPLEDK